ncbi:MAG: lactonase family protein [Bacteroidota bacterium]
MSSAIKRRNFLKLLGLSASAAIVSTKKIFPDNLQYANNRPAKTNNRFQSTLFAGTYTNGKSKGIYSFNFDTITGELNQKNVCGDVVNPSFLAIDNKREFLYAVSETDEYDGKKSGGVYSYKIDGDEGKLHLINSVPSNGAHPCHIIVDKNDCFVLVANYSGGNISVIKLNEDGSLGETVDVVQHSGSSVNKQRQEAPHAHSINLDSSNKFAVAADLGLDKLMLYNFDNKTGKLIPAEQKFVAAKPGAGPRHFAFHPGGEFAFAINELDCTITAFRFDTNSHELEPAQTVPTLPVDYKGENTCAEIQVHPNGKFIYGSNRGHDSIAVFSFVAVSGNLFLNQHQSTMGKTPRNFVIDPTGKFLLVANQSSDSVIVFSIDLATGRLYETGKKIEIPNPVCLLFV